MRRLAIAAVTLISLTVVSAPVSAALITYTAPMAGFTHDSDTQSAAFLAALGAGYTHISFSGASSSDGTSYSSDVTFSTKAGIFGGANSGSVNFDAGAGEIGPFGTWDGILNIDFLANGNTVSAVGFGLVEFDSSPEMIRVYNELDVLIGTFNNQLGGTFSLWGVAGNAGERIGRIELDGNFFGVQDIEFNAAPEPASLALLGLGLAGLGFARRRRSAV